MMQRVINLSWIFIMLTQCLDEAVVSTCNIQTITSDLSWNLTGTCNITNVLSTFNNYTCHLWQKLGSSRGTELASYMYSPTLDNNIPPNVYGSCTYSVPLPTESNSYIFTLIVTPGDMSWNAGNITIVRPVQPPRITCLTTIFPFVREIEDLICECTSTDLGVPKARLLSFYGNTKLNTSNYGDDYLYFRKKNVTRSENRTIVKCVTDWATPDNEDLSTNFTLQVAYGPSYVTPTVLSSQPFDTDGFQNITLNCSSSATNPPATIIWLRSREKTILRIADVLVLTPKPPDDDGLKLDCLARNPVTYVVSLKPITIDLNYPPTSSPVITVNEILTDNKPVYEGDNVTLSCTVSGGKPVNATVITFTCPNKNDVPDSSFVSFNVTSSLEFFPVSSQNHGACQCYARWKNTDWYKLTAFWNLSVYTSPSSPMIFLPNNTTETFVYPFMVGTSGILSCHSDQPGRPEATYTWPVSAAGYISGNNLIFYNLSREDNGRAVKCRASNSYTENRRPVDDATFVLQVYYEPAVTFTGVSDSNDCVKVSSQPDYRVCVVADGQRVHINCTADSNPPPAAFLWLSPSREVYSNSSELMIPSANHTIHNGDYNCTVVTNQNGDSRLPLKSSALLTVIVGFSPNVLAFSINDVDNMTVSIKEKSRVNMKCVGSGRPTPSIHLTNAIDPERILNVGQPPGSMTADDQTEVSFIIDQVPCEASGVYRCDVNNSLGQHRNNRTLLVLCAPRRSYYREDPPVISVLDGKGELNFTMTAYPTPEVKNISYLGATLNDRHGETLVKNTVLCSGSSLTPTAIICSIILHDVTRNDKGFYKTIFANSLGQLSFTFFVDVPDNGQKSNTMIEEKILVIVLATLLAVVVSILVVVIWLWRRGWNLPCTDTNNQTGTQQNQTNDLLGHNPFTTETPSMAEEPSTELYDVLRAEDVGRSPYEEIRRDQGTLDMPAHQAAIDNTYESFEVKNTHSAPYERLTKYANRKIPKYKESPYQNISTIASGTSRKVERDLKSK